MDTTLTKRAKTGGLVEDLDNMLKRRKIEQKSKEDQDVILKITGNQLNFARDLKNEIDEKNKVYEIKY